VYRSPVEADHEDPDVVIERALNGANFTVRYGDGTTFVLNREGSDVGVSWTTPLTAGDVATYLFGPVFGLLLYLRGLTCLHASAIAHNGKALVFVGAAEAGKSTLAAAYARLGYRVLTDDILVLVQETHSTIAQPGIPRVGLWPESVDRLWGNANALPRQTPTWEKRYLDLSVHGFFQDSPLPVGAVYVLADREAKTALRFESLAGTDAVLALIANKYVTRISEREQEKRDFILLSELATSVPVRRIARSDDLADLYATCDAILADYDALALARA
jgi:hypothetical protein